MHVACRIHGRGKLDLLRSPVSATAARSSTRSPWPRMKAPARLSSMTAPRTGSRRTSSRGSGCDTNGICAMTIEHLFIVGAGFSSNAGLPLTSNFTEKLLDVNVKSPGPSTLIVKFLQDFVEKIFGHGPSSEPAQWPELEDIFTCIDLSANTGHHLGDKYSPSELRTVRRALIVRIIRMLDQTYKRGLRKPGENWPALEDFFSSVRSDRCAFLSTNWDTVIEQGLERRQRISSFDYGCGAIPVEIDKSEKLLRPIDSIDSTSQISILKPHGSANWLYSDACRQMFWVRPDETQWVAGLLFKPSDKIVLNKFTKTTLKPATLYKCPICSARALGTRFATFSYRKALDFPMHERTWASAEKFLWAAKSWVFIGYSLPAADY
jgi:hypothetical protein